jgi:hypothetical protein
MSLLLLVKTLQMLYCHFKDIGLFQFGWSRTLYNQKKIILLQYKRGMFVGNTLSTGYCEINNLLQ